MKEFPGLVELHKKYPSDVACISLSLDNQGLEPLETVVDKHVLPFLKQQGATFDNVVTREEDTEAYKKLGLTTIPAVLVYDRAGKLHKKFTNDEAKSEAEHFTYKDVEATVKEMLPRN